jgi:hypothetical protein
MRNIQDRPRNSNQTCLSSGQTRHRQYSIRQRCRNGAGPGNIVADGRAAEKRESTQGRRPSLPRPSLLPIRCVAAFESRSAVDAASIRATTQAPVADFDAGPAVEGIDPAIPDRCRSGSDFDSDEGFAGCVSGGKNWDAVGKDGVRVQSRRTSEGRERGSRCEREGKETGMDEGKECRTRRKGLGRSGRSWREEEGEGKLRW